MAAAIFLVSKDDGDNPNVSIVDGVTHCLINEDDTQTDAQIIAAAEAQCVAAGHPLTGGYFTTVEQVDVLNTLDTDGDIIIFRPNGDTRLIA